MKRPLSVAHLTAIDLPPPAFIEAAARAGFDGVGLRVLRVTDTSPGYPLQNDPAMLRATKQALQMTGLRVMDIEFLRITPETRAEDFDRALDAGAELGARHVITAPYDDDLSRLSDTLAQLALRATERGISPVLEFFPWTSVPDLTTAQSVVERAGDTVGILVDALHFNRSNSSLNDLAAIAPHRLPFAHLCDAQVQPQYSVDQLLNTARAERLPPGEGQIDLSAFIAALPVGTPLTAEVPMAELMQSLGADGVLSKVYAATKRLVDGGGG